VGGSGDKLKARIAVRAMRAYIAAVGSG